MSSVAIEPILHDSVAEVGKFLHANLNRRFSAEFWSQSLLHRWAQQQPNHGMQLRHDGKLVGVFCALYSDQSLDGRVERICNPHSWCVLPDYRRHSIGLLLQLLKQREMHFVMLTPNPDVAKVFLGLKFRLIDDDELVIPNIGARPGFGRNAFAESLRSAVESKLTGQARRDFEAHSGFPWLHFVAFGVGGDTCLVVFKRTSWKRLPCAKIIHVSDPQAFDRHSHLLRNHLLLRHGIATSRVEARWLLRKPWFALRRKRDQPKLVLSPTLSDAQIGDLYSELVALDI